MLMVYITICIEIKLENSKVHKQNLSNY